METLESKIEAFLRPGYGSGSDDGYGYGYGYGSGYGDGDGYGSGYGSDDDDGDGYSDGSGYGYGYGSGSGYGDGDGYGYGSGSGSDVKVFNGQKVYSIDDTPTIINAVHGSYAQGFILNKDLTLSPCYIARVGNSFAHGDTLHEAQSDAAAKELENMPLEDRIKRFYQEHSGADKEYPARDLFIWHGILTGSCNMGRRQFCKEHDINLDSDKFTVRQFIELTINAYGSDAIKQLQDYNVHG